MYNFVHIRIWAKNLGIQPDPKPMAQENYLPFQDPKINESFKSFFLVGILETYGCVAAN